MKILGLLSTGTMYSLILNSNPIYEISGQRETIIFPSELTLLGG